MSDNPAFGAALTEYVESNAAIQKLFQDSLGGSVLASDMEPLLKREREAREKYAKELETAGHAVPAGFLDY